jgi:tetrahydromethanopterin S-methyltransferase subunit A
MSIKLKDNKRKALKSTMCIEQAQVISEIIKQLKQATSEKKCLSCGCLHDSLATIERAFVERDTPGELDNSMRSAKTRLLQRQYDCLGCKVCYPAIAINELNKISDNQAQNFDACSSEEVKERVGWPPLPGNYNVLRYRAPVAICTLTNDSLRNRLAKKAGQEIALVGTLQTENLGIERILSNVLGNPNIRFIVVCGADSRPGVGHLPGQSLIALANAGLDKQGRIIGAKGKRPVIRNLSKKVVEHFRKTVDVINLIGTTNTQLILKQARACAERYPGPAKPLIYKRSATTMKGYINKRMIPDPSGYFVIYVDKAQGLLCLEHYSNDGILDILIEGQTAAELYLTAIDKGLISRLDHAAYIGQELTRAEQVLKSKRVYVQDSAPEHISNFLQKKHCGCDSTCQEMLR